jgi:hypothetical protein
MKALVVLVTRVRVYEYVHEYQLKQNLCTTLKGLRSISRREMFFALEYG